jgi:hypothetical protein
VHHAGDGVVRAIPHRQARAMRAAHAREHCVAVGIDIQELDRRSAGRHEGPGLAVGQSHDTGDHLALVALQDADMRRLGDDQFHLLLGHAVPRLGVLPEQPENDAARLVEDPDQRPGKPRQPRHGRRDPDSHGFGIAQRDLLRDKLADDQRQVGDGDDDQSDAERVGNAVGNAEGHQPRAQARSQGRTRERAGNDADERFRSAPSKRSGPVPPRARSLLPHPASPDHARPSGAPGAR